jgi:hypothetical protein
MVVYNCHISGSVIIMLCCNNEVSNFQSRFTKHEIEERRRRRRMWELLFAVLKIIIQCWWTSQHLLLRRMVSSGLLRRVALVRTDVSEESGASFIRVTKVGELGTTQAATSNRRTLRRNVPGSSETSVLTRATRRNNPEDTILHSHRRENLKSYIFCWAYGDIYINFTILSIIHHPVIYWSPVTDICSFYWAQLRSFRVKMETASSLRKAGFK